MDMEMSMDIIEMARDLGRALQADEKYQRYVNATLENDKDQVLQDLIGKFNTLRVDINREISKSEKDQEKIARLDSEFKTAREYILRTIIGNYNPDAAVLISTHLIADVEPVLDDVIFIDRGHIALTASVDYIREEKGKSVDALFREVFRC